MFCFVLQRTPTNENNSGTEWQGIQQLLHGILYTVASLYRSYNTRTVRRTINKRDMHGQRSLKLDLESISYMYVSLHVLTEKLKDSSICDISNKLSVLHVHIKCQNKYKQRRSKSIPFSVYRFILYCHDDFWNKKNGKFRVYN